MSKTQPNYMPLSSLYVQLLEGYEIVSFSNCNIGDDEAASLAVALKDNVTLRELILSCNEIGKAGAEALAVMLKDNNTIERLDLAYNQIGADGANAILSSLKHNNTLKTLNFFCSGAEALENFESLLLNTSVTLVSLDYTQLPRQRYKQIIHITNINKSKFFDMKIPSKCEKFKIYAHKYGLIAEEFDDGVNQDVVLSAEDLCWCSMLCI